ncbi:unnamed protein product [Acanthoscelides obtectus]|uniref:Uncharacterized protein n=1 Tax=Acanthoscelides obtectus TaxID=200917 RepID=A0A9P0L137_ACAOB|nr:unnamed protein product [Acanthoscelides obtectus]CAK1666449.1 hypothetical protein AOBTE_LOCUS25335 [Acanthoscelides obtectus]
MSLVNTQNRNSSSGYVSCSECSYDSDTCTCVSADKCYCSLGHKNFYKKQKGGDCPCENNVTYCDCDTDSCTESNKCYCTCGRRKSGVFEDLKKRGFMPESKQKHKKLCKKVSNTKSTQSLEYILNPSESYYEKLKNKNKYGTRNSLPSLTNSTKVDYELPHFANQGLNNLQSSMVYTRRRSEHDLGSRVFSGKGGGSANLKKSSNRKIQATTIPAETCHEALSVKKSAEIAALFTDVKLSQTTDITHLAPNFDVASAVASKNSYNKLCQVKYTKPSRNSSSRSEDRPNYVHLQKNQSVLYSKEMLVSKSRICNAKNGLYTIQSQSDESRRSSMSEGKKIRSSREFLDFDNMRNGNDTLETSLGYLP